MSGHSKWHNIRVKKTAADKARGKIYTKHAKMIEIAAQRGGDPDTNSALKNAIVEAKADSVPNANIDRAIAKGTGVKGEKMEEVMYACMAPAGVACLIECLSDNTNRTLGNVKTIISKNGGVFTESSSVLWMFARRGVVVARKNAEYGMLNMEGMELKLIDVGAEDVDLANDTLTVTTDIARWTTTRDFLKQNGWEIQSAGLRYVAQQKAPLSDEVAMERLAEFVDALEEDDDVSEVHTNADM